LFFDPVVSNNATVNLAPALGDEIGTSEIVGNEDLGPLNLSGIDNQVVSTANAANAATVPSSPPQWPLSALTRRRES
jgi:hypothetical protein